MAGYAAIGLDNPKCNNNVGSVLRAAQCYDAALVVTAGKRYEVSSTDTMKYYRQKPLICVNDVFDAIPYDCVPVAVDLLDGAEPLQNYKHPKRAFYIFGAEDATLDERITGRCRDRVFVPTKHCMNLAATVNVVLYDRLVKSLLKQTKERGE